VVLSSPTMGDGLRATAAAAVLSALFAWRSHAGIHALVAKNARGHALSGDKGAPSVLAPGEFDATPAGPRSMVDCCRPAPISPVVGDAVTGPGS